MAAAAAEERRGRGLRAAKAAMRALRGARDMYVRGVRGFGRFVEAGNPRAGAGRPTSRVFGVGGLSSEQDLRELVRAVQARRGAAGDEKAEAAAVRRVAPPLERIDEDAAAVQPAT